MKITANTVTIARIVLLPLPAFLLYQEVLDLMVAFVLIIGLAFTDWLDGRMARREGTTVLGGLLDPIADKIFIAVCFIPFSERTLPGWSHAVIPLWMLILMLCRDFLVTSLRTSLSMRGAPMRTSLLAKYKTAIQMAGVGYLLAIVIAELLDPTSPVLVYIMAGAALVPGVYILYRALTRGEFGRRSITMTSLTGAFALVFGLLGARLSVFVLVAAVTGITVFSGFSYLSDAWSALRGKPRGGREVARFVLEGVLMPAAFLLPLHLYDSPLVSFLILLGITLELATGGLANLLAERKVQLRFRLIVAKSLLEVLFAGFAIAIAVLELFPGTPAGELCMAAATSIAVIHTVVSFVRHRRVYLDQI